MDNVFCFVSMIQLEGNQRIKVDLRIQLSDYWAIFIVSEIPFLNVQNDFAIQIKKFNIKFYMNIPAGDKTAKNNEVVLNT